MQCRRAQFIVIAAVGPLLFASGRVQCDDHTNSDSPSPPSVAPGKSNLHRLLDESAAQYKVYPDADANEPSKLRCVLRWANQTRGSVDGATYIWTSGGRPVAAVCCYPWIDDICDNFQSLGRTTIRAERDSSIAWRPKSAGVSFQKMPVSPVPTDTAASRLRQMKELARSFSVTLLGWAPGDPDREQLRLLDRPVYRYESDERDLLDGALFAFVQGTDPEALLMIEAVAKESDKNSFEWEFAFARRTSGWLEARQGDLVVWKAEKNPEWRDPTSVYFQLSHRRPKSDDPK